MRKGWIASAGWSCLDALSHWHVETPQKSLILDLGLAWRPSGRGAGLNSDSSHKPAGMKPFFSPPRLRCGLCVHWTCTLAPTARSSKSPVRWPSEGSRLAREQQEQQQQQQQQAGGGVGGCQGKFGVLCVCVRMFLKCQEVLSQLGCPHFSAAFELWTSNVLWSGRIYVTTRGTCCTLHMQFTSASVSTQLLSPLKLQLCLQPTEPIKQ